jgi:hypothetical protein
MLVGILEKSKRVRTARISLLVKFDMLSPEFLGEAFGKEPAMPAGSFRKGSKDRISRALLIRLIGRLFRCGRSS